LNNGGRRIAPVEEDNHDERNRRFYDHNSQASVVVLGSRRDMALAIT